MIGECAAVVVYIAQKGEGVPSSWGVHERWDMSMPKETNRHVERKAAHAFWVRRCCNMSGTSPPLPREVASAMMWLPPLSLPQSGTALASTDDRWQMASRPPAWSPTPGADARRRVAIMEGLERLASDFEILGVQLRLRVEALNIASGDVSARGYRGRGLRDVGDMYRGIHRGGMRGGLEEGCGERGCPDSANLQNTAYVSMARGLAHAACSSMYHVWLTLVVCVIFAWNPGICVGCRHGLCASFGRKSEEERSSWTGDVRCFCQGVAAGSSMSVSVATRCCALMARSSLTASARACATSRGKGERRERKGER